MADVAEQPEQETPNAAVVQRLDEIAGLLRAQTAQLLSPTDAAAMLGISVSKFHALAASGLIGPEPLQLGDRCPRYSREELVAWIRGGGKPRSQWRFARPAAMKMGGAC